jgi:hypothetical protein
MKSFLRSYLFWTVFLLASSASFILFYRFFHRVFPLVNVDITADRTTALHIADEFAQEHQFDVQAFHHTATFHTDYLVQIYAELEAPDKKDAFAQMIKDNVYMPYTWNIRYFKEFDPHELWFYLTPSGTFYGFYEALPETDPGQALSSAQARALAEQIATNTWHVSLEQYDLVESSQETQPSNRIDHTFVYERTDQKLHEAPYRLTLVVSGNRLTGLTYSVKVPELFLKKYTSLRSTNESIASAAQLVMMVLYLVACGILGMIFLLPKGWIVWRPALYCGIVIAFLQLLNGINQLPLAWIHYNSSIGIQTFLFSYISQLLYGLLRNVLFYTLICMSAESLGRKAFGTHMQLWSIWKAQPSHSLQVLGQTVAGYLIPGFQLLYVTAFYSISHYYLGWWSPSSLLIDPNILATYFPWLSPVVRAFTAGFSEECIFRALPLACAALLGNRFGKKKLWIGAAFILQIIVFGAAHANYPAQPAYARVFELIIPSAFWGILYLYYGLVPTIISHGIYDVILMAMPLFTNSMPSALLNQIPVLLLSAVPLLVLLKSRLSAATWISLPHRYYNAAWAPESSDTRQHDPLAFDEQKPYIAHKSTAYWIPLLSIAGLIGLWFNIPSTHDGTQLSLTREQAVTRAQEVLHEHGIVLEHPWTPLTRVDGTFHDSIYEKAEHLFIWNKGGQQLYQTLLADHYLSPPYWLVRFVRFEGTLEQRAEEYRILLAQEGTMLRLQHKIPESIPGASLSQEEARTIARNYIQQHYQIDPTSVVEIKAIAHTLPQRKSWVFTFSNPAVYHLSEGQARIAVKIDGDTVVDAHKYIHVPEQWKRSQLQTLAITQTLETLCTIICALLALMSLFIIFIQRGFDFTYRRVFILFCIFFVVYVASTANLWPYIISNFNTSQPFTDQSFRILGRVSTQFLIRSLLVSVFLLLSMIIRNYYKATQTRYVLLSTGLGLGLGITGILSGILYFILPSSPVWASFDPLNYYIPVGTVAAYGMHYIIATITALIGLHSMNFFIEKKQWPFWAYTVLFMLSFLAILGYNSIETITTWLATGIIGGGLLFFMYYYILRYNYALIPLTIGIYRIMPHVQEILLHAYPAALLVHSVGIFIIATMSIYWTLKLHHA